MMSTTMLYYNMLLKSEYQKKQQQHNNNNNKKQNKKQTKQTNKQTNFPLKIIYCTEEMCIICVKLRKEFFALLDKYSVSLKAFLQQGISELEFYDDLVYIFRK